MTTEEEAALLDGISAEIRQLAEAAYQDLLQRLRDGESPRAAIQAVTATFSGEYYYALSGAFSAILGQAIGLAEVKAWPIADVALSERLYAHSREVSAVTRRLIAEHAEGFVQARELALRLYEGYQFKVDPLTVKAALPKYLRQAMKDPGVNQSLTRVFSRIRADALKTPALKAAYLQAIDAAEAGAGAERLRKLLRTAWYERNRYFANRIAQTELHRAYSDQVAQDLMADEGIQWVQVVMSRSHPKVDICDYHARLNAYGQGPGVYPKPKAPKPTFHPFCRCVLVPRPDLDGDPDATPIPGADRAFMASLTKDDQRLVAGSRDRLNQFLSGKRLEAIHDAGVRQEYRLRRVGDVPTSSVMITGIPDRTPWGRTETVLIAGDTSVVQGHPSYVAAKGGDLGASMILVGDIIGPDMLSRMREAMSGQAPILVGVHAVEGVGVNAIPQAMAAWLNEKFGWPVDDGIVQINRVGHTKSSGWHRLANQALFDGDVTPGAGYLILDDFIGQGGTMANLRGHIEKRGGIVVDFLALTGKPYSATLSVIEETLQALRVKHGNAETWWKERFGFGFDALTESEARYLLRAEDADTIRNRLAEAKQKSGN